MPGVFPDFESLCQKYVWPEPMLLLVYKHWPWCDWCKAALAHAFCTDKCPGGWPMCTHVETHCCKSIHWVSMPIRYHINFPNEGHTCCSHGIKVIYDWQRQQGHAHQCLIEFGRCTSQVDEGLLIMCLQVLQNIAAAVVACMKVTVHIWRDKGRA